MDAIECMKTRRSVRVYQNKPVPKEIIEDIVDCGRLAASAINIQPWVFVAVTNLAMRKRIADTTDHGKFIEQAPVCIAVFCQDSKYYLEDGCAATQNILNAAKAYSLGSCWIAGDKKPYAEAVRALVGAPATHRLIALVPVGWPAEHPQPAKKPLAAVLHWERFGGR